MRIIKKLLSDGLVCVQAHSLHCLYSSRVFKAQINDNLGIEMKTVEMREEKKNYKNETSEIMIKTDSK